MNESSLVCDKCGNVETEPYAVGDSCVLCGGTFREQKPGELCPECNNIVCGTCPRCGREIGRVM